MPAAKVFDYRSSASRAKRSENNNDGEADAQHLSVAQEIADIVTKHSDKEPGPEATFGSMAWSHQLVHLIGGEDDTNKNTTQRILLLLESWRTMAVDFAYTRRMRAQKGAAIRNIKL